MKQGKKEPTEDPATDYQENKGPTKEQLADYQENYSDSGFWNKLQRFAKRIGKIPVYKALELFYAAKANETPSAIKALIYGALGYFIFPIDIIPDVMPIVGFTDDLVALGTAITAASQFITPVVRKQAKDQLKKWFGDISDIDADD